MKSSFDILPCVSIYPSHFTTYNEIKWNPSKPSRPTYEATDDRTHLVNENFIKSSRSANGILSKTAKKKINTALDYLLLMSQEKVIYAKSIRKKIKFKICFVTLTLPSKQIHTDDEIKRQILNSFLIELTRYHNVKNYLWRAEKQKNGNIHFHIILDQFIIYNDLRKRWNRICNKLGYVDRYSENMKKLHSSGFFFNKNIESKRSYDVQYKAYIAGVKCNWASPNSTDIHSVRFINNIRAYIAKYMTKSFEAIESLSSDEIDNLIVKGRLWGCNENLSNIKGATDYVDNETESAITKIVQQSGCKVFKDIYFSVYYITIEQIKRLSPECLYLKFCQFMIEKFDFSMQLCS